MFGRSHVHKLTRRDVNVIGYCSKRNDGVTNDVKWYGGDVQECACGALIFFPHSLALYPVEVDLATAEDLKKIWPTTPAQAA